MSTTRRTSPLAALALITLVIAGCSSTSAETGTGAGASASGTSHHSKAVRFAECMRTNGVGAFPDPDASGKLTIDAVANGASVNTEAPAFKQALGACKALEPSGFTGNTRSARRQQAALKFAQCIRSNGVTDFPDPIPNAPLVDTNRVPSAATPSGMSILNAAMQRCRAGAIAAGVTR